MKKWIITKRNKVDYETILEEGTKKEIISRYKNDTVKLDEIIEEKKISYEQLQEIIKDNTTTYFPYGIKIDDSYILCEEIALNQLIIYKEKKLNIPNLNIFFEKKGIKKKIAIIEELSIFQTNSIWLDHTKEEELYYCNEFHIKKRTSKEEIKECIKKASMRLTSMQHPSGRFLYGINGKTNEVLEDYNLLRHIGALWSLVVTKEYNETENLQERIENGIEYIRQYIVNYGKCSYLSDLKHEKYVVGGNGLFLLLLTDFENVFKDKKYHNLAEQIANGILRFQMPNGRFNHVLDKEFEVKKKYVVSYYDGESTLGLIHFYKLTKDKKYLDAVEEAFDYFIKNNYGTYADHWISHTLRELVTIDPKEKYFTFTLSNMEKNKKRGFRPTRLESDMGIYLTYQAYKENKKIVDIFPIEDHIENIKFNVEMLMSHFIGEEKSIYVKKQKLFTNGFWAPNDDFRMRIDDIQHAMIGLRLYCLSDIED